jgi:hypothetical protein
MAWPTNKGDTNDTHTVISQQTKSHFSLKVSPVRKFFIRNSTFIGIHHHIPNDTKQRRIITKIEQREYP